MCSLWHFFFLLQYGFLLLFGFPFKFWIKCQLLFLGSNCSVSIWYRRCGYIGFGLSLLFWLVVDFNFKRLKVSDGWWYETLKNLTQKLGVRIREPRSIFLRKFRTLCEIQVLYLGIRYILVHHALSYILPLGIF